MKPVVAEKQFFWAGDKKKIADVLVIVLFFFHLTFLDNHFIISPAVFMQTVATRLTYLLLPITPAIIVRRNSGCLFPSSSECLLEGHEINKRYVMKQCMRRISSVGGSPRW